MLWKSPELRIGQIRVLREREASRRATEVSRVSKLQADTTLTYFKYQL